jgi:hypothetical protein
MMEGTALMASQGRSLKIEVLTRCSDRAHALKRPTYSRSVGRRRACALYSYCPSQLTRLFQSTNAPLGFSLQAQTCSSKNAARAYRFGLFTN